MTCHICHDRWFLPSTKCCLAEDKAERTWTSYFPAWTSLKAWWSSTPHHSWEVNLHATSDIYRYLQLQTREYCANVLLNYIYSTPVYFIAYDFLCTKICNKCILNIAFLLWLLQTILKTECAFISVQVKSQWWWISTFGHTLCESLSCSMA